MGVYMLDALNLDLNGVFLLLITVCAFLVPIVIILPPVPLQKSDALLQTHSLAGLTPSRSNLKTQFSTTHEPQDAKPTKVQSLMVYPIKSCKGIEVSRAKVLPYGLEFDRLFTFAQLKSAFPVSVDASDAERDNHTWSFITLRQFARLANVTVELWLPDEMKMRKQSIRTREAFLILKFPWKDLGWRGALATVAAKLTKGWRGEPEREVLLPVEFPTKAEIEERGYEYEDVTIWKDTVSALNMSKEIPKELRLYLGVSNKLALFRVDPAQLREVYKCAPRQETIGYQPVTGFSDGFPLHIQNISSVQKFAAEVPKDDDLKQLNVLRFRPNIIVSGSPAYDEDTWKRIRLTPGTSDLYNDLRLDVSCRTVRCKLPNVDPENGYRHPVEPDKSLRKLRDVDGGAPRMGCLGMQATPLFEQEGVSSEEDLHGWVGVGMEVTVDERGEHFYLMA
ncbi:MOSC domain-containing protein [Xylariales sp. AK1849]|nr:MOSC domain-containing protein [Xylariales sp. AK1849]